MQDMMLYSGQKDNYLAAQEQIQKYLGVRADDSQIHNLVSTYGRQLADQASKLEAEIETKAEVLASKVGPDEHAYAMIDGSMVLTREAGSRWKEMKLGRLFVETDLCQLHEKRRWIRESLYSAHFGDCERFMSKLSTIERFSASNFDA